MGRHCCLTAPPVPHLAPTARRIWRLCMTVAVASLVVPVLSTAAPICPPEVKQATDLLKAKSAIAQKPKSQAGARGQETQAPAIDLLAYLP